MDGLTINIAWEYFLGIMGGLILIAWYSSARFTKLETSMEWVRNTIHELKVTSDNEASGTPVFGSTSPVSLKPIGEVWLRESGWVEYIESHKGAFLDMCETKRSTNPYEVQQHIFHEFDILRLESEFEDRLKKFAYEKGTTMTIMRRVGAIYFRDICLKHFGMNREDIDAHDPDNKPE